MSGALRYCGRVFTEDELEVVRGLAASLPTRRAIVDALCDALPWLRPDGRTKDMSARVRLSLRLNLGYAAFLIAG